MRGIHVSGLALAIGLAWITAATAQGVAVAGFRQDNSLPVEISADSLQVDQTTGSAVFQGNVLVGQGPLKMSADRVEVVYAQTDGNPNGIDTIRAEGSITLTNGVEAAEAESAIYSVTEQQIDMTGQVLLTQGPNALSGDALQIDLETGLASMQGRVKTIIQPEAAQ